MNRIDNCTLILRTVCERCGGYDTALPAFEDWDVCLHTMAHPHALTLGYSGQPAFAYRVPPHPNLLRLYLGRPSRSKSRPPLPPQSRLPLKPPLLPPLPPLRPYMVRFNLVWLTRWIWILSVCAHGTHGRSDRASGNCSRPWGRRSRRLFWEGRGCLCCSHGHRHGRHRGRVCDPWKRRTCPTSWRTGRRGESLRNQYRPTP